MADKEKPPEWNLFERLEEVESLYLKQSYSLDDVTAMAGLTLVVALAGLMWSSPNQKSLAGVIDYCTVFVGRLDCSKEVKKQLTDVLVSAKGER